MELIKKHYSRSLENSPASKKLVLRELGIQDGAGVSQLALEDRFHRYKKASDPNLHRHPAGVSTNQTGLLVPTYNSKSVDASLRPE